jgi:uncharacterized membrane-anchored protein
VLKLDKKFLLMIAFPAIIIIGMIAYFTTTVSTGQEILLKTEPVDPTDLFRGAYAALTYEVSTIDTSKIQNDGKFSEDNAIYAALSKKEDFWTVDSIHHQKPALNENQVCMKGTVRRAYDNEIFVEWGIESFFADPETAKRVEREGWRGNATAIVSAGTNCHAILRGVIVGNETIRTQ